MIQWLLIKGVEILKKNKIKKDKKEKFSIVKFFSNMLSAKNSVRLKALKENKMFQRVILILGLSIIAFYMVGYSLQLGEIVSVIQRNDKAYVESNHMLYDVESYTLDSQDLLTVKLKDGDVIKFLASDEYKFILTKKLKQDECKLDKEDSLLICGVNDDYGKNILTGNNVYMMWGFMIFMTMVLIVGVSNKMPVLGGKTGLTLFSLEFILFSILTMFTLTYF